MHSCKKIEVRKLYSHSRCYCVFEKAFLQ